MNDFLNGIDGIMSQGFGFIAKIPMRDPNLTPEAKAIYAYICSFAGAGGTAFPGIELMLKELKMSKDRFYKHRKLLEAHGYIEITSEKNEENKFTRNIYKIVTMPVFNQEKFNDYTSRIEKEKQRNNQPCPENQETDLPCPENKDTGNQDTGNQETIKNSSINNSLNNNSINILSKKERKEEDKAKNDEENTKGELYPNEELQNVDKKETKKNTSTVGIYNQGKKEKSYYPKTSIDYSTTKNKNQDTHETIIMEYTKSAELIDLLKEYLIVRYIQNNKKPLTNRQLKLLLSKLSKLAANEDEKIEIVSNAVIGGFKTFYHSNDKEPLQRNKSVSSGQINANKDNKKIYDLSHDEYVAMMYEKEQRDRVKISNSLSYNWLEQK